jgi:hypothetical protein
LNFETSECIIAIQKKIRFQLILPIYLPIISVGMLGSKHTLHCILCNNGTNLFREFFTINIVLSFSQEREGRTSQENKRPLS